MSEKRRDNKGRLLKTGEHQEKDGRYSYRYTDSMGKRRIIRSWRLSWIVRIRELFQRLLVKWVILLLIKMEMFHSAFV